LSNVGRVVFKIIFSNVGHAVFKVILSNVDLWFSKLF
jgi:hypothetical protein